jgi:peptidoglycan hydrolase-like protein with peptidoglycan-binding domain
MKNVRHLGALVALSALVALPAEATPAATAPLPSLALAPTLIQATSPTPTPAQVRAVQGLLRQQGDYHLRVDGKDGGATRRALARWQRAHNLNPTGIIDTATLQAMNIQ